MSRDNVIPVITRTARQLHTCARCRKPIDPGEQYEDHRAPPWTDGNEGPRWVHAKTHVSRDYFASGCDEAAAYRENEERNARA